MKFETFKRGVLNTFRDCCEEPVRFFRDNEAGKYIATCKGVTIVGNSTGLSVKVKWNRGQHQSIAVLAGGKFVKK